MPKIEFILPGQSSGSVVDAAVGESVLDVALSQGISLQHACGGFCACTTCHCDIEGSSGAMSGIEEDEAERLQYLDDRSPQSRLACQTKVKGDLKVRIRNPE